MKQQQELAADQTTAEKQARAGEASLQISFITDELRCCHLSTRQFHKDGQPSSSFCLSRLAPLLVESLSWLLKKLATSH